MLGKKIRCTIGITVLAVMLFVITFGGIKYAAAESSVKVEHIFTHELVFDADRAFAPTNKLRDCFDKDHMTTKEFAALLASLYERDYVLVSLDSVLDGTVKVPSGKHAVALSVDDLTYDTTGRGCIDKLVMRGGIVYDYTENAEPKLSRERECVTILESFIDAHPDFSPYGARATLCVNGYNGILGYRVTPDCRVSAERMASDTQDCKKLVHALKSLGYTFASHTYYHKYFNSMSEQEVARDIKKWKEYIEPIVGRTRVLCFPAGEHNAKSGKMDMYISNGFDVFLCVGAGAAEYERSRTDCTFVYRKPFDGTALRLYKAQYARFCDTQMIYDDRRFRPFSYKGNYHR